MPFIVQLDRIEMIKLSGLRVIRSQDWKSGDQDGGESSVGTLVPKNFVEQLEILFPGGSQKRRLDDYNGITIELALDSVNEELARDLYLSKPGMINVIWDCGMQADYRAGREDAFDLKVYNFIIFLSLFYAIHSLLFPRYWMKKIAMEAAGTG